MIKKIISIILVLVWMVFIFYMSNANGTTSGGTSRKVIVTVVELFTDIKETSPEMENIVERGQFFVRKGAHFFEYAVLAFLVMNSLYIFGVNKKTLIISGIICILYAISDEVHQCFIADRSGNVIDVMWDSSASLITSCIYYRLVFLRGLNEKRNKK